MELKKINKKYRLDGYIFELLFVAVSPALFLKSSLIFLCFAGYGLMVLSYNLMYILYAVAVIVVYFLNRKKKSDGMIHTNEGGMKYVHM